MRWLARSDAGDRAGGLRAYTLRASRRTLRSVSRAARESLATRDALPHDARDLPPTRRPCGWVPTSVGLRESDLLTANLAGGRCSPAGGHLRGGRGCRARRAWRVAKDSRPLIQSRPLPKNARLEACKRLALRHDHPRPTAQDHRLWRCLSVSTPLSRNSRMNLLFNCVRLESSAPSAFTPLLTCVADQAGGASKTSRTF